MSARADAVVLVDADGTALGVADRLAAHRPPGMLHAAISLVVRDREGRVLIQRRARGKALFAGRWSNACCTHPAPGESAAAAAERRARQELGIDLAGVREVGAFVYRAVDPVSGLVEHERDTVLVARSDDIPSVDPDEVLAWAWADPPPTHDPSRFTPWAATVHEIGGGG